MGEGEDRLDAVRAACWKLCDAKDLCCSAPLCEGWGGVDEWRGEGDDDGKGIDDINEVVANIVVDGYCGVGNDGCTTIRCAIDLRSNAKESPMDTTEREAVGLTRIQGTAAE